MDSVSFVVCKYFTNCMMDINFKLKMFQYIFSFTNTYKFLYWYKQSTFAHALKGSPRLW